MRLKGLGKKRKLSWLRSFGVSPIVPGCDFDEQGRRQRVNRFHLCFDQAQQFGCFVGRSFEHELVVDLQEHSRSHPALLNLAVNTNHG